MYRNGKDNNLNGRMVKRTQKLTIKAILRRTSSAQIHHLVRTIAPQITTHKKASQLRGFFI